MNDITGEKMLSFRLFLLMIVLALLGVTIATAQDDIPLPTPSHRENIPMPTDELITQISYVDSMLKSQSDDWYFNELFNGSTTVRYLWRQDCCLSVFYIDEVNLCCGGFGAQGYFAYDEDMIPHYERVLVNYEPYEIVKICEVNGVKIHEFKSTARENTYYIRHFHYDEDNYIVTNTGLYFTDEAELERYSQLFFPDISCPDEASPEATEEAD